ncbi:MAG: sensor histidine kinase, partial [Aeromicrobium sp.]
MKRLLPSSLTDRLVVTVVALVAVASILIGAVTTIAMHSSLTHRLDTQLEQALDRATGRTGPADPPARPPDDGRFGGSAVAIPPGQSAGTLTAWFNSEGYRGDVLTTGGERKALSRSALQELLNVDADGHVQTVSLPAIGEYRVLAVETDTGTIVNGLPTSDINGTIESMIWWTTLLALGGTALAAGAGRFLVRRQLRPLQEVAATAHDVAALPLSSGEVGVTMRVPD